ncbi:MAG: sigma-70 family RNA polymerase sigma factor [Acidovorax sp.]|uniref:sigma-70 family RNA polymerase sigma factor n=1 Tax=Acidovorax sp. TaxID=1872122 RepID=UPI0039E4385D
MPARQHHPPSIALLYADHHGWLQGWLRRRLGDASHAQDLAHDTFVQLLEARHLPPLHSPRAFITLVAQRTVYAFWRRRDLEQAFLDALASLPPPHQPSEEQRYAMVQALNAVDRTLGEMPRATRQVLLLNRLHHMTYREIAERLGIAEITVRRHMARAITALSQHADTA